MSTGSAHGAVTIINATATGIGCSLAIDAPTTATWAWEGEGLHWRGATDDRLARALHKRLAAHVAKGGATVDCHSTLPATRGLKTSSAAALAMARAGLAAADAQMDEAALLDMCIDAAVDAGVTITGAYDDQIAVARGGCHMTDNGKRRVLASFDVAGHVAVWVPDATIPKSLLSRVDLQGVAPKVDLAVQALQAGDVAAAMSLNGKAYHAAYRAAGFPVDDAPTRCALENGASGAGLSGTGPAVSALFDEPTDLPDVPGGTWRWYEVVA